MAGVQWDRMQAGTLGEELNPWAGEMFRTLQTVKPSSATEQSAFDIWLSQRRRLARRPAATACTAPSG